MPATDLPATDVPAPGVDPDVAEEFVRLFHTENPTAGPAEPRVAAVREEIARTGTYVHTHAELEFGARIAWRNSARCIGRLYWRSLHLRDRRHVTAPEEVAQECVGHLRDATRRGRIRSTITIFAPDGPAGPGPRVWNEQLIRYAGYRAGGRVLGDPRYVGFTDTARSLGWLPPSPMGRFDVLPLVVSGGGEHAAAGPQFFEVPRDAVLEVALAHAEHPWFAELGLRWHALPVISNMRLDIGGISYPAAPFNGWYMATEISARNLADSDRYDMLGEVAEAMGLDTSSDRTLWRDRAAIELTARGAALLRRGRRLARRPPRRVAALPALRREGGGRGASLPGRLELDRPADLGRAHAGVPPVLRRAHRHRPDVPPRRPGRGPRAGLPGLTSPRRVRSGPGGWPSAGGGTVLPNRACGPTHGSRR